MSLGLAIGAAACLAATVQLHVAPDQPQPHVYVGDPLILELESDGNTRAAVSVTIEPDYGDAPVEQTWDAIELRAHATRWLVVDRAPEARGRYELRARIEQEGAASETVHTFCRVNRPLDGYELPVSVAVSTTGRHALPVLRGINVGCAHLDAGTPDLAQRVDEAAAAGFRVVVVLRSDDVAVCGSLAEELGDRVAEWQIDPGGAVEALSAAMEGLRQGGARSRMALVVRGPETVAGLLAEGCGPQVSALVYQGAWPERAALARIRQAARQAGYEDLPLNVGLETDGAVATEDGPRLLRQLLTHFDANVSRTHLDVSLLLTDEFGPGYAYLGALAHRMEGAVRAGRLDMGADAQAFVFRQGTQWTVAAWTAGDPLDAELPLGDAEGAVLIDARNNLLPLPEVVGGGATISLSGTPVFVAGQGGTVPAQAAQTLVRRRAAMFMRAEALLRQLPPEIAGVVGKFAEGDGHSRLDFFNLLKLFPHVEALWRAGGLPTAAAVPALAGLDQLARAVCVVEQERGEPFVEPLQNTLANCGQFQSLYITSSAGSSEARERPDWIFDRVTGLMAEAEALAAQGRPIEANAVAALAEWRARSLEVAAGAAPAAASGQATERETRPNGESGPAGSEAAAQ